jgi:polyphosphate glucokinase
MTGPGSTGPESDRLATILPVTETSSTSPHRRPFTLSFDIGGTGLKADVLDKDGAFVADRVKIATTYPMPPERLVEQLTGLADKLPKADRTSAGFPGMVRNGDILSAPHFVCEKGPGSNALPELVKAWSKFDLAHALAHSIGKPCRVANDADVQGLAVVEGTGFEAVVTLGTGVGTAFFMDGRLLPHLEFSHVEFRKGDTFNEQLGEPVRKKIGDDKWNGRVRKLIAYFDALTFFDHLYLGGGNAQRINRRDLGEVLERITVVDNTAGIVGGIRLWGESHLAV